MTARRRPGDRKRRSSWLTAETGPTFPSTGRGWPAWAVEDRTGRLHPLCGVYMKDCLPLLLSQLEQGCRRVTQFFYSAGGQVVSLADTSIPDTALSNINTPEDWNRLFSSGNI